MTKAQIIDNYIQRIMVDYPEADKIHIDLVQFAEELRQCSVSGSLPLNKIIEASRYGHWDGTSWQHTYSAQEIIDSINAGRIDEELLGTDGNDRLRSGFAFVWEI